MTTMQKNLLAAATCIVLAGCAALLGFLAQPPLATVALVTLAPIALLCGMISAYWYGERVPYLGVAFKAATYLAITCMAGAGLSFVMAQADFGIIILGLFGLGTFFAICLVAAVSFAIDAIETHADTRATPQNQTS